MRRALMVVLLVNACACFAVSHNPTVLSSNLPCDLYFNNIDGACANPDELNDSAIEMPKRNEKVKIIGNGLAQTVIETADANNEVPLCTKYKTRLKNYLAGGVYGINPATGKVEKLTGQQARDLINDTKENIKMLCGHKV